VSIDLWGLEFQSVDGAPVKMAGWRGRPLLLNFWATWCAPCVVEMPLLDRFSASGRPGLRVLALAIDGADKVRGFVAERASAMPVALAGADGIDLSRALGNKQGALPFTVLFDAAGTTVARNLGAVTPALLTEWVGLTGQPRRVSWALCGERRA
jgi:thiol-disulfide isomerase/thioredoxin